MKKAILATVLLFVSPVIARAGDVLLGDRFAAVTLTRSGLALTTYEAVFPDLLRVSTPERDYIERGFKAGQRSDEVLLDTQVSDPETKQRLVAKLVFAPPFAPHDSPRWEDPTARSVLVAVVRLYVQSGTRQTPYAASSITSLREPTNQGDAVRVPSFESRPRAALSSRAEMLEALGARRAALEEVARVLPAAESRADALDRAPLFVSLAAELCDLRTAQAALGTTAVTTRGSDGRAWRDALLNAVTRYSPGLAAIAGDAERRADGREEESSGRVEIDWPLLSWFLTEAAKLPAGVRLAAVDELLTSSGEQSLSMQVYRAVEKLTKSDVYLGRQRIPNSDPLRRFLLRLSPDVREENRRAARLHLDVTRPADGRPVFQNGTVTGRAADGDTFTSDVDPGSVRLGAGTYTADGALAGLVAGTDASGALRMRGLDTTAETVHVSVEHCLDRLKAELPELLNDTSRDAGRS